jgi:integrase
MRAAGDGVHGRRLRGLIVVLWRAGLRITEALALGEADLDPRRGSLLVRRGKNGRRREVGMDEWAWEQLKPWLAVRLTLPVGPLFCITTAQPVAATGQAQPSAPSSATAPRPPASGAASPRTSSATPTPARWPAKECR